jgi:hypothetical protein
MAVSKRNVRAKHTGLGLEIKTFPGKKGTYVVFKLPTGAYHTFLEVQAKAAAVDCGADPEGYPNTRVYWDMLWNEQGPPKQIKKGNAKTQTTLKN